MTCTVDYLTRILNIYNPVTKADFGLNESPELYAYYDSTYIFNG